MKFSQLLTVTFNSWGKPVCLHLVETLQGNIAGSALRRAVIFTEGLRRSRLHPRQPWHLCPLVVILRPSLKQRRQISSCITARLTLGSPNPLGFNSWGGEQQYTALCSYTIKVLFLIYLVCEHTLFCFLMNSWVPWRKTSRGIRAAMCQRQTFPMRFNTHTHTQDYRHIGVFYCICEVWGMLEIETVHQPYCIRIIYLGQVEKMTVA